MKQLFQLRAAVCATILLSVSYVHGNTDEAQKAQMTQAPDSRSTFSYDRGCIIRGPRDRKRIALEFTGGSFADGGTTILDELKRRNIKASFFFTGDFYRIPEFKKLIVRIRDEGHYLGPHSDKHPLYASWENPPKLLVSKGDFNSDLDGNFATMQNFGIKPEEARFFIPPYEHFTTDIVQWAHERKVVLINYTPGARSHADYMEDDDKNFIAAPDMVKTVYAKEESDPDGLSGWLLLMHIGAGPGRTRDHLYNYVGGMLDELRRRGYEFVRVDEMLAAAK